MSNSNSDEGENHLVSAQFVPLVVYKREPIEMVTKKVNRTKEMIMVVVS